MAKKQGGRPNYARTGLKVSGKGSDGVMNQNLKILVQIIVSMHRGAQEKGTVIVYSHL